MVNTLVFADEDGDGITSTYITQAATDAEVVLFQEWSRFGLEDRDIELFKSYKPKNIYVLDIGSDADMLQKLSNLSEEIGCEVTVLDNHPPEDISHFETFFSSKTRVFSTHNNCTAGIAYDLLKEMIPDNKKLWAEIWALVGIHSDFANNSKDGKRIVEELTPKHPELFGSLLTPKKSSNSESGWETIESSSILRQLVSVVNIPKRVFYHYGARLMYNAMKEIEETGNLLALWEPVVNDSETAVKFKCYMPSTWVLRQAINDYYDKAKQVFSSDNNFKFWDFGTITVSQINHPWNLGGYVANFKAPDRHKTHFSINLGGIDPNNYKVTARWDNSEKSSKYVVKNVDVGKVFKRAGELSNNMIKGGGLKQAGSAMVNRIFSPLNTIRCLVQASQEVDIE